MYKIEVLSKPFVVDLGLTERATKSEAVRKQGWNFRLVVSVPDVGVEAFYDSSNL